MIEERKYHLMESLKRLYRLQPSNIEILFELGVGDKIIGATDFDNYPEEASILSVCLTLLRLIGKEVFNSIQM